jgi:3-deoxy-D-manno-octulosonate 8-phosphate phosphatase (KDO 8-P phosphatase)
MLEKFKHITSFVFDVDGVLTDGTILVLPDGVHARKMNIKDGYALQLAAKKGYKIFIISGGDSLEVKERLQKLGIAEVHMKVANKSELLHILMTKHDLTAAECLYMGDDIPDKHVMQLIGLPCCPADAVQEIKAISTYISPYKGGEGCVREVVEKVMKLRGDWNEDSSVRAQ